MNSWDLFYRAIGRVTLICVAIAALIDIGRQIHSCSERSLRNQISESYVRFPTPEFNDGVNCALQAFVLLNLEQQIQGTNRSFKAMARIVCERLNAAPGKWIVEPEETHEH